MTRRKARAPKPGAAVAGSAQLDKHYARLHGIARKAVAEIEAETAAFAAKHPRLAGKARQLGDGLARLVRA